MSDVSDLKVEFVLMMRENKELRELLRDMWEFGFSKNAGANSVEEWHAKYEALADRMRELGVS